MNDFLSAAEIDALFDQANSGRPPADNSDSGPGRRTRHHARTAAIGRAPELERARPLHQRLIEVEERRAAVLGHQSSTRR